MGVVYKATDTTLDRDVALKFLNAHLNSPESKTRFAREAKAAASLNHPHIATIYEYNEVENPQTGEPVSYIAMEFVEGKTLSTAINSIPVPVSEAARIALSICEALNHAHSKGIVHRDIKSENIMLTDDGQVKVMDFGLADIAGISRMTKEGTTVGTIAYMSPEQASTANVDHRSDLWSFGVVFYEMLTGRLPFIADYEQALIYQILNEQPDSIKSILPDIEPDLERIVLKLLEKDPARRYQNAGEVIADLKMQINESSSESTPTKAPPSVHQSWYSHKHIIAASVGLFITLSLITWYLFTSAQATQIRSLAVLPFENLSQNTDEEYFADGMTDQLIAELCKIHSLRVISRTSAMQFKGKQLSLQEIARILDVEGLITATVLRSGERIRVNAQLTRASDEANLWGDTYDRKIADVLDLTTTLARSITDEISAVLTPAEKKYCRIA